MGGQIFTEKDQAFITNVARTVFLFGTVVTLLFVSSWVALFLSFAGLTPWPLPPSWQTLLLYFCISFCAICATLWLGSQVEIFKLRENADKMIGKAFAVGCLGAIVSGFVKLIK